MKIVLIIQARLGSTRLPKKVLSEIEGMPMLSFQHERLKQSNLIDKLVIATTENSLDDDIVKLCVKENILYFRGSEKNVLKRFYDAATYFQASHIVRCNADCPLIDPVIVDLTIKEYLDKLPKYDYASTILDQTYPLGMHVEVFSYKTLTKVFQEADQQEDLEHVTPYIYNNSSKFNLLSIKNSQNLSKYRWTVDYGKDLSFVRNIVKILGLKNALKMNTSELVKFLIKNEELLEINKKYKKSQKIVY